MGDHGLEPWTRCLRVIRHDLHINVTVHSFVRPMTTELYALKHNDITMQEDVKDKAKWLLVTVRNGKTGMRVANPTIAYGNAIRTRQEKITSSFRSIRTGQLQRGSLHDSLMRCWTRRS